MADQRLSIGTQVQITKGNYAGETGTVRTSIQAGDRDPAYLVELDGAEPDDDVVPIPVAFLEPIGGGSD